MVDSEKISLVITTYNRDSMTARAYSRVVDDERIGEVVIVDDCSSPRYTERLKRLCNHPKVKLFFNQRNLGCYKNKQYAISQAAFNYVIIFDSDNILDRGYLDALSGVQWSKDTILAPDFARPHFNYSGFSGVTITKENVKQYVPTASRTKFDCLINTMNYFVHRDEYLRVWDGSIEPWTADTIFQNYNWLKAGNKIHVVKGMQYDHLVHDGSHYREHVSKTQKAFNGKDLYKEIENKLMRL